MKTKFFILGAIVSLLSVGTFTNATQYEGNTFTCYVGDAVEGYNQCDDDYLIFSSYTIQEGTYTLTVSATNGLSFNANVNFEPSRTGQPFTAYNGYTQTFSCEEVGCYEINPFYYHDVSGNGLVTYTITEGGSTGGGDSGTTASGIIAQGVGAFSGIITKLTGISGEFVPYIIYIAIALLGISLTINVVKYILGYLKGGAENSITGREGMKARRTRRRRNRRFTRYERKNRQNYQYNNGRRRYRRRY